MIAASLPSDAGYGAWRDKARIMLAAGVEPAHVAWRDPDERELLSVATLPALASDAVISAPRAFIDLARKAALHSSSARFPLLYRVLWRLQREPRLMEDAADPDIVKLHSLAKAVRRDEHKMHAFVRFREIAGADGARFVAWFEPQHYIVEEVANFFVRRFAGMRWSIITPQASLHWDGEAVKLAPGGVRTDVPEHDARDEDWRAYYESMFNPARLKVAAMKREMPKRYWRNLPEARLIPDLVRAAESRTDDMVAAEPTFSSKRAGAAHARIAPETFSEELRGVAQHARAPTSFDDLAHALSACRACPLWRDATQAVPSEGRRVAPLLALVGEQPGDQEDLAGRPFVGPAGKLLDRALGEAGIVRADILITNAVKHFKHEPRGKRRLHKRPERGEVEICRWWLKHELALAKPKLVVALGGTALQSLSTHRGSLGDIRGRMLATREGAPLRATVHPSYLLRLPDRADQEREFMLFVKDLKAAKEAALAL